jgi:hypothetical protein
LSLREEIKIPKDLNLKEKARNSKQMRQHCLSKYSSNFEEGVELNEHTRSPFILPFKLLRIMFIMHHLKLFVSLKAMIFVLKCLSML